MKRLSDKKWMCVTPIKRFFLQLVYQQLKKKVLASYIFIIIGIVRFWHIAIFDTLQQRNLMELPWTKNFAASKSSSGRNKKPA